ncbi:MAG: glycine/sarcosine/betaine reductase selenoprotein B family protein [Desulfuromonadales bacterium]|nr:glycine/sarcosine/betaine reductase selenoprotein B family protein [Desulfuromonadales bacterium]
MDFTQVEKEFIRNKVLPDFDWTCFDNPTQPVPLQKPVTQCRVALVVTAGAYLHGSQQSFATKSPTGDDSFRIIPNATSLEEISLSHPGYNTRRALQDLDCVFPLVLLNRFQKQGEIGTVAPRHFSFMGFIPQTERLLTEIAPRVAAELISDQVDLALLVPS